MLLGYISDWIFDTDIAGFLEKHSLAEVIGNGIASWISGAHKWLVGHATDFIAFTMEKFTSMTDTITNLWDTLVEKVTGLFNIFSSDEKTPEQVRKERIKELQEKDSYNPNSILGFGERSLIEENELNRLLAEEKTSKIASKPATIAPPARTKLLTPEQIKAESKKEKQKQQPIDRNSLASTQGMNPEINTLIMEQNQLLRALVGINADQTKIQAAMQRNTRNGNLGYSN